MAKSSATPTVARNREITLPAAIRRRVRDASQMYFWTNEWQCGEHEAQEDIRRGRLKRHRSAKALIADLKR